MGCRYCSSPQTRFPDGIYLEGVDLTAPISNAGSGASTPIINGGAAGLPSGDDFFSTWDKPATPSASSPAVVLTPTGPPSVGAARPTPRTVTSSSLRNNANSPTSAPSPATRKPTATRLSSSSGIASSTATSSSAPTVKSGRLGAKKAGAPINFEEAQRKALEEEDRIKRLGYDRKKEEEERIAREKKEAEQRSLNASSRSSTPLGGAGGGARSVPPPTEKKPVRLGFGATAGAPVVETPRTA